MKGTACIPVHSRMFRPQTTSSRSLWAPGMRTMERMEKEGKEVIYPEGMEPYTEEEMDVEEEQAED